MFDGVDPADLLGVRDFARSGLALDRDDPINRGLVGLWPMMENGSRVTDLSDNRRHLTLFNSPGRVTAPFGQATNLASASSQYATPASTTYTQTRSFVAWVRAVSAPAGGSGNTWVMTSDDNFGFNWNNNNAAEAGAAYIQTTGHGWQVATLGGTSIPAGVWHCLIATWDGATLRAYRNGVLTATNTPGSTGGAWTAMAIGRNSAAGTGYFNGAVALIRDFNRVVSASEAVRFTQSPFAGIISEDDRLWLPRRVASASPIVGTLAATTANATLAATGALPIVGTAAATTAAATLSATGRLPIVGTAAQTTAAATLSSTARLAIAGAASVTTAAATVAATGALPIVGTTSPTTAAATLSAAGTLPIVATLSATLASATLSATGSGAGTGVLAVTLDSATLAAAAALAIAGQAAITTASATLSSAARLSIVGQASPTTAGASMSATGALAIVGSLTITTANATLLSYQSATAPSASRRLTLPARDRTHTLAARSRGVTLPPRDRAVTLPPERI